MQFADARADIYPYLLVNIGSGVSMIKVSGPQEFERIGGSSVGILLPFVLLCADMPHSWEEVPYGDCYHF